ncbi:hypothetical protein P3T76_008460 [Phytophthora citrophthora]|uniref:DNA-directed DNA polymerase n=1 Tax=Phytophthora citrophthora TaxID=4793 RepID=A0AAD9GKF2_9STRA|nr:hypothetical protein P3T76_008460 [Phytophthora citrophthora]
MRKDHILVGDNNEWTYKSNTEIFGKGDSTYLKLEDVLQERSMLLAARSRRDDWEDGIFDEDVKNPNRPYVVHRMPLVNDSHEVGGVYAVHCGLVSSFNPNTSDETNFVVKVGRSDDILRQLREHQQTRSLRKHGEVVFLFGVEIDKNYQVAAENLLKDMLTELGFPHVKEGGAETYAFNETTLPLIHDDPPIGRQVCGHKNSAENPLLEQGLPHELQTLVQKVKNSYRVKVRGRTGKMVYITNISNPKNMKLVAQQYNVGIDTLKKHTSPDYKADPKYRFYQGNHVESHLYEGIQPAEFYDKIENVLASQKSAFKINIALGYNLVSRTDDSDTRYFYPNLSNTSVFSSPIAINSKGDIRKKVISEIRSMELADKLNYSKSGYLVKAITGFKIFIYQREHALGDSEAVIPKIIRDNKSVINFPKANNKCVFHCIAYHKQEEPRKDPRRIQALVKQTFKQYCSYKDINYTLSLFRSFKPIDILQFDELEDCFQLSINVFTIDVETGNVECVRRSDKDVNTNATIYRPASNTIRSLLTKYSIKNTDQYIDHFIVYDFEAILKPTATRHGENTVFTNEHIPVSVSVADSLTEEVRCFVNDDPKALLKDMFHTNEALLRKIIDAQGLTGMEVPGTPLGNTYKTQDVDAWIQSGDFASFFDFHSKLGFGKKRSDYGKIKQSLDQVPVLGFNSGRYDINLIKADLFATIGTDNIKSVIKNPSYMCIATSDMKMLDISNYVPAGTSYAKYLSTYLGDCKCDDKIRCVCGLGKGIFPYEYITSFNVLNETEVPPQSAFDSELRNTSISDDDYKRVQFVWEYYGMKSIKDLLICSIYQGYQGSQRELFKRFGLDMFTDGLSEKVMYQTCFNNLQYPTKAAAKAFSFPSKRMSGYKSQDAEAKREFNMTIEHLDILLKQQKYLCGLCYCQLTVDTVSADRINNKLGHIDGNILISCVKCNTARKNMSIKGFRYKKLLEFNSDKLVYSIDREEKDIYAKMKANIAGGPSIIFNRYAKRNETKIRGDKVCKKIIGYDANALYLWALGNEMPCGRLTTIDAYPGIIDDIVNAKVFGFLECDIRTPPHLKEYFSEMTPIFKNTLIDCSDENVIGQHMFEYNEARKQSRAKPARKLIGSYFGEKILIYAPLLKWYIAHGMEITKTYCFIKANSHKAFEPFMEAVSNARREGDADKSKVYDR